MKRHVHHFGDLLRRQGLAARRTARVLQQPLDALGHKPAAPSADRQLALARCRRDRASLQPVGRQQHDLRPPNHLLGGVAVPDQPFQLITIRPIDHDRFDPAHRRRLACPRHFVNQPSETEH